MTDSCNINCIILFLATASEPLDIGYVIGYPIGLSRDNLDKQKQLTVNSFKALLKRASSVNAGYMVYGNAVTSQKYPGTRSGHAGFMNAVSTFDNYPGRKSLADALDRVPGTLFRSGAKPEDSIVVIYANRQLSTDDANAIRKLGDQGFHVQLISIGDDIITKDDPILKSIGPINPVLNPNPDRENDIDAITKNLVKGKREKV